MNSPKKNKFRSKRSKRIRFVPVISDVSNTPLDAENTELANLIETKVTSGILPQDIDLPITSSHYLSILKYIFSKHYRNKNEILLIKHYLSSFKKFQTKSTKDFNNPNDLINKIPLCIKFEAIEANRSVCLLGELGDKFYIIFKGSVAVLIPTQYQFELTESEYFSYLKKLFTNQEFEIFERTIAANRHMYLSPELYELINNLEEARQEFVPFETTVEQYIDRVKPDLDENSKGKKNHVNLWTYKMVCSLQEGASFGDVALSGEAGKRTATILTLKECYFGTIRKEAYEICIKETQEKMRRQNVENIYSHSIFKGYSHDYFEKNFFNLFNLETLQQGQFIFKQGEQRSRLYILKKGDIEITFRGNFHNLNTLISYLGGENNDEAHDRKEYGEMIRNSSFFSDFYNKNRTFRIWKINKNDIIGLDDYIFKGSFAFNARVVSQSCSVFCLEKNFYDEISGQKRIMENIKNETEIRKSSMINRIKLIKRILLNQMISNLENDFKQQKEIFNKEYTSYTLYKKNAKTMKQKSVLDTSSFNTNITSVNNIGIQSSCVTSPKNKTNSKILLTEMSLLKKRKKNQQMSTFSLNKTSSSFHNMSRNIQPPLLHENKASYMSNISLLNRNRKPKPISLRDAKLLGISPFFINSFFSTNVSTNPHINELYLLRRIKMQNEIEGTMRNKLKQSEDPSNNKNLAKLDFLAFDNYVEKLESNRYGPATSKTKEKLKPIYKPKVIRRKINIGEQAH